jgi:NAD dependent epimerase/dehydratase family enzyme
MTHVILGATGKIGTELPKCLCTDHHQRIRLVSRSPRQINNASPHFKRMDT